VPFHDKPYSDALTMTSQAVLRSVGVGRVRAIGWSGAALLRNFESLREKGAGSLKPSVQDWIWTFLWPIGGAGAGMLSLGELFLSDHYHPWGPLLGLCLSGVGILSWLGTKGGVKVILGLLAFLGIILNLVAGALVIVALAR
jgi:hypothetical protein